MFYSSTLLDYNHLKRYVAILFDSCGVQRSTAPVGKSGVIEIIIHLPFLSAL